MHSIPLYAIFICAQYTVVCYRLMCTVSCRKLCWCTLSPYEYITLFVCYLVMCTLYDYIISLYIHIILFMLYALYYLCYLFMCTLYSCMLSRYVYIMLFMLFRYKHIILLYAISLCAHYSAESCLVMGALSVYCCTYLNLPRVYFTPVFFTSLALLELLDLPAKFILIGVPFVFQTYAYSLIILPSRCSILSRPHIEAAQNECLRCL